jgi:BON domain
MIANWKRISIALGLLAAATAAPTTAAAQALPAANQRAADAVAGALGRSPALAGSRIEVDAQDGRVVLSGAVASPDLKAEAIARAARVPGVQAVTDRLRVVGDPRVVPVQYTASARPAQPPRMAFGGHVASVDGLPSYGGMGEGPGGMIDGSAGGAFGPYDGGISPEGPAPEGLAGGASPAAIPHQPNYAWPSYAPYPNFSAVGYPTTYPWQAWPNIGPFYPYPEVPLDWRAVTLRWDDGIWWLDFKKHYTRPFFTPYPFGIFGY